MNFNACLQRYFFGHCILFCSSSKRAAFASAPVEPGKFDLVYQNPDGTERVEYAVSRDARVSLHQYLLQNDLTHLTKCGLQKKIYLYNYNFSNYIFGVFVMFSITV